MRATSISTEICKKGSAGGYQEYQRKHPVSQKSALTENKDSEESEWYLFTIIDIFTEKCITGVYKLNIPQIKLWYNLSITVHKLYMNDQPPIQDQMLPTKPDISKTILMGKKDKDLQCSYIVLIMPCQWKKKGTDYRRLWQL